MRDLIARLGVHEQLGPTGEGWGIEQNPDELAAFVAAMQDIGVKTVLEIGTGYKAGLARFMTEHLGWDVVSVDRNVPIVSAPKATFIHADTQEAAVQLAGRWFDLVIIDADHSYEAVRRDHGLYGPLAAKAVMFHDIAGLRACEGAARYWIEIAYTKRGNLRKGYYEARADGPHMAGIGWLVLA